MRASAGQRGDGGGGLEAWRLKECLMRQTSRVGAIISMGVGDTAMVVVEKKRRMATAWMEKRAARNRNSTGRRNSGRSEI